MGAGSGGSPSPPSALRIGFDPALAPAETPGTAGFWPETAGRRPGPTGHRWPRPCAAWGSRAAPGYPTRPGPTGCRPLPGRRAAAPGRSPGRIGRFAIRWMAIAPPGLRAAPRRCTWGLGRGHGRTSPAGERGFPRPPAPGPCLLLPAERCESRARRHGWPGPGRAPALWGLPGSGTRLVAPRGAATSGPAGAREYRSRWFSCSGEVSLLSSTQAQKYYTTQREKIL